MTAQHPRAEPAAVRRGQVLRAGASRLAPFGGLAVLVGLLLVGLLAAPATAAAGPVVSEHVVVVGVPGLLWSDVTEDGTPQLWGAAEDGSIGAMTVRGARSTTCVLDGWVTLGAGNRARFIEPPLPLDEQPVPEPDLPGAAPEVLRGCLPQEASINLSSVVAALDASPGAADDNSFGAQPGVLGTAVSCAVGVGRGPVLTLHRDGSAEQMVGALPTTAQDWAALLGGCPLSVVSLPELVTAPDREPALKALDTRLGLLRLGLPPDTDLLIAGISETGLNTPALHVAIEVGPGVEPGYLSSASTQRTPFVQLIDVAPTALTRLGLPVPAAMVGQPFTPGQDRPTDLREAVDGLIDVDLAARAVGAVTPRFFTGGVVLMAVLCLLGWVLIRVRQERVLSVIGVVVASLPAATLLGNLVPWWRAGNPGAALALTVAVVMAAIAAVALGGPWRSARLGPAAVVTVVTFATLAADVVLLNSRLQLSSLLGYNPIVAGRFSGFGNIPYGLYAASALLTTTLLVHAAPPARRGLVLSVAAVAVVAVDGAPWLGNDFGGVLALVPAYIVFALLLQAVRVSVTKLALAGLSGGVVVMIIATLDYQRPPAEQTHLGRFVGQLLDGSAGTIVSRKAQANIDIFSSSPLTLLVPVFAVTGWWLLRRGGPLEWVREGLVLRAGLLAVLLAEGIGLLVNDSGVAVPVTAGWFVVPLVLAVAAGTPQPREAVADRPTRVHARDRSQSGVTVNSRDGSGRED